MSELIHAVVFGIGVATCIIGAIGVGAAITLWAVDRVTSLTKTTWIIACWWFDKQRAKRHPG